MNESTSTLFFDTTKQLLEQTDEGVQILETLAGSTVESVQKACQSYRHEGRICVRLCTSCSAAL